MSALTQITEIIQNRAQAAFLIESVSGTQLTYAQFWDLTRGLAGELLARGVRAGDRVAIILPNCLEYPALYLACLCVGAWAAPTNPGLPQSQVEFLLTNAGCSLVVHSAETQELIPQSFLARPGHETLCLLIHGSKGPGVRALDLDPEARPLPEPPGDTNPWTIHFTSGTTGQPKGVVHSAKSMLATCRAMNKAMGWNSHSRMLHLMPMFYIGGFMNTMICPLLAGGSIVIAPVFDAKLSLNFWRLPMAHAVNTMWLVPTMVSVLLRVDRGEKGPQFCRERMKSIAVGTAPLPVDSKRRWDERYGVELNESYALSETLFLAGNRPGVPFRPGSAGTPFPGVDLRILDVRGKKVPTGEEGEVSARCPFMMLGYLDYATGSPQPLESPWFPTGDVGYLGESGHLFITGRSKDIIIRGGINLSPRAVEEALWDHPAVNQAAVVGMPDPIYGEEVTAVLNLCPGIELGEIKHALIAGLKKRLDPQALPTRFVIMDPLPTGSTGKIHKGKIKERLAQEDS